MGVVAAPLTKPGHAVRCGADESQRSRPEGGSEGVEYGSSPVVQLQKLPCLGGGGNVYDEGVGERPALELKHAKNGCLVESVSAKAEHGFCENRTGGEKAQAEQRPCQLHAA